LLSDSEIIQQVTSQEEPPLEDDTPVEDSSVPSSDEVMEMFDKCLLWYEQQPESTATSVLLLKRLRDLAATKRFTNLKQLTLDSYLIH